jgi:hypothetical protein
VDPQSADALRNETPVSLQIFYEFARTDSAHDLRLRTIALESLLEAK